MAEKKLNTAVIGAGKMGQIHAKVYHQLGQSSLVGIVDSDEKNARQLAKKYKCPWFTNFNQILDKVDAVTVSTPTICHKEVAIPFIERGIGVLIEKPLALNTEEAEEMVSLAEKHGTVVAVGHSERCNPVVQAMKRLNVKAKFIESHRISPYPFRSTDIGVVMDVMIHDIDIILSLAGSELKKADAVGIGVIEEDKEDICNARLVFENGCIANVTASRIALKTERKVRVFSKEAYLSLDYFKKTGTIIKADVDNLELIDKIRNLKNIGKFDLLKAGWSDMVHYEKLQIDDKEPLRVEQESFLKAVADKSSKPEVTAKEGLAAMKCAHMILESIKEHQWQ